MSGKVVRGALAGCVLAGLALAAAPASARSRDMGCNLILQVEGGFTYRLVAGLSLLDLARAEGPFRYDNPGNVIAFMCMRSELMPDEAADLEILQAGYGISIGDDRAGLRVLELRLAAGRINAEMIVGALGPREQRQLRRIVAAMQARLDAGAR
jgi:hypothetical protein